MPKVSLNTIGSRYGSIDALNDNFDAIEAAIENTLSLDGTSPNAMTADLDLNSNDLLNVGTTNTQTLYINGVEVEPNTGVSAGSAFQTYSFTATAGQTTFSVAPATPLVSSLLVSVNGLELPPADVTVSTTNVVIPACTLGDEVVVRRFTKEPTVYPTAATQDFQQAGTGAQIRTVQSKLRDVVSVLDFGADPTGVADSATAINNALTAVESTGGVVEFGPGTFIVGSTILIPDNCSIQGAGQRGATTIKLKASANVNIIEAKSGSGGNGIGISDLTFDGNQANNTQGGVYLVGVNNARGPAFTLNRVRVTATRNCVMATGVKTCFYLGGNVWSSLQDIEVHGNDYAQISMWVQGSDGVFNGIYLGQNGYSFGGGGVRGLFVTGAGNFFTNCYFGGTQPGPQVWLFGASATGNKFTACIMDNAGGNGLQLTDSANYNLFVGCQIGNSSYSDGGTYYAVNNAVTGGRNAWIGCRFYSLYATAYATVGYLEGAGVDGQSQIVGCEFDGTWLTSAVSVPATSTTQFVGNFGYDLTTVGTLKATTRLNVTGPYDGSAPSVSSTPLGRFNGGGALSLWAGSYAYTNTWLQSIQDDGSNNLKTLVLNPLGGLVQVGLGTAGNSMSIANGTANGTVATTLGSVGPTGSTAGNPQGWMRINVGGTDRFIPYW